MKNWDTRKLRGRIVEKYGSLSSFTKAVGISNTAMSKKMNCKAGISQNDVALWCELLDIRDDEIGAYFYAQKVNQE